MARDAKGEERASPYTPYSTGNSSRVKRFQTVDSKGIIGNSQWHGANVFRVDDPRSEPLVLCELTRNLQQLGDKMEEDTESTIATRFVGENDYRKISAEAMLAERKLKKNRPSWLVLLKQCCDVDLTDSESSGEEDEEVRASEEEAVTETDSELESANAIQEFVHRHKTKQKGAEEIKQTEQESFGRRDGGFMCKVGREETST